MHLITHLFTAMFLLVSVTLVATFVWEAGGAPFAIPSFGGAALWYGLIFCLAVSFFWFNLQYLLGLLAFWLEETWVLRVIFQIIVQFFSGSLLPLEFFPKAWVEILIFTPFPYLTHLPVNLFMGKAGLKEMATGAGVLFLWGLFDFSFISLYLEAGNENVYRSGLCEEEER